MDDLLQDLSIGDRFDYLTNVENVLHDILHHLTTVSQQRRILLTRINTEITRIESQLTSGESERQDWLRIVDDWQKSVSLAADRHEMIDDLIRVGRSKLQYLDQNQEYLYQVQERMLDERKTLRKKIAWLTNEISITRTLIQTYASHSK